MTCARCGIDLFNWAIRKRYTARTPFKQHGVALVQLDSRAEAGRSRRLEGDEERRLLASANDQLMHDLIVAAVETGCRRGELLSLQWPQVKRDALGNPHRLELVAAKTKTRRARTIPVTDRLREVLERRQYGPDGQLLGPGCYVFGSETGDPRKNFRGSWELTCEAAQIPQDDTGRFTLHFHDLRREFASRLLESGATLAEVQAALGRANITMTSRYLDDGRRVAEGVRAVRRVWQVREGRQSKSLTQCRSDGAPIIPPKRRRVAAAGQPARLFSGGTSRC